MKFVLNPFTDDFDAIATTNNSKSFELTGFSVIKCCLGVDVTYTNIYKSDNITAISVSVNGSPIAPLTFPFKVEKADLLEFQVSYPYEQIANFTIID